MSRAAFIVESPRASALRAINYAPELEALARPRRRHFRSKTLRSLVADLGRSYWAVFTRKDCDHEHGVELITQVDMFAAEPAGRIIRRDSMPKPEEHEVKRWQILIAGAGQLGEGNLFGRSIIADNRLAGRYLGPHAVSLGFVDAGNDLNLWTYAFLNTSLGLRAVKSCAFGTSVPGLRLDLLAELPIPVPEKQELLERVANLVRRAVEQREIYLRELRAARGVIESLPEMREAHAMCAERRARCVTWKGELPTLSAWTYASTGGALELLQRRWSGRIGTVLEPDGLYYGLLRQRTPCDPGHGLQLISQRDALSVRQIPSWIAHPGVPKHALFSPAHSLIMAGRGTLGDGEIFARPIYVTPHLSAYALTQDLLRIVPRRESSSLLYAYLSTLVGRRLLRSAAVGTKILQLRSDLVESLPFPDLSVRDAAQVRRHHEASIAAYDGATKAEIEAIRIIEEEVLPAWLT